MAADNVANVTVTGKAGPGLTLTAAVFSNCQSFKFDPVAQQLILEQNGKTITIAIATTLTVTVVVASGNYTVTVA